MENQPPVNAGEGEKKKHEHNETSTTASKDQNTVKAADSGSDPSTTITPSAPAAEQKRKKPENVGDGNDDAEEDSDFDELDGTVEPALTQLTRKWKIELTSHISSKMSWTTSLNPSLPQRDLTDRILLNRNKHHLQKTTTNPPS